MLLDADILIDIQRGHVPAITWIKSLSAAPSVSGFAALELAHGCRNKAELRKTQKFLSDFPQLWPAVASMTHAYEKYADLKLSKGLGLLDSLIGATAIEYGEELATFNNKHYSAIPGLIIVQPYVR